MMMMRIKDTVLDLDKVLYFSYSSKYKRLHAHFSTGYQDSTVINCTPEEYNIIAKEIEINGQSINTD